MTYTTSTPMNTPRKYNTIKTDALDYLLAILSHYSCKSDGSCLVCLLQFIRPPFRPVQTPSTIVGTREREENAATVSCRWTSALLSATGFPCTVVTLHRRSPWVKSSRGLSLCQVRSSPLGGFAMAARFHFIRSFQKGKEGDFAAIAR